jgi:hypothetical protein
MNSILSTMTTSFREIMRLLSQETLNELCGKNSGFCMLQYVVHIVTTGSDV